MQLTNIYKKFDKKVVFEDFSMNFDEHKITCILGKSGCGKTTLLNIIAGVITAESGVVVGKSEKISYIFQNQLLLKNLTVYKNLEYVLKNTVFSKEEINKQIKAILDKVQLSEYAKYYPKQLSGGMAQRVSLARAFVYPSDLILMDEPFKGLDVSLKKRIMNLFKDLYRDNSKTTIFVTHDIEESLILGDRIIVLDDGGKILLDKKIAQSIFERDINSLADLRAEIYNII
ncbi:MAG: ABC transporter ATP-binding protein [Clostridia bacterium]